MQARVTYTQAAAAVFVGSAITFAVFLVQFYALFSHGVDDGSGFWVLFLVGAAQGATALALFSRRAPASVTSPTGGSTRGVAGAVLAGGLIVESLFLLAFVLAYPWVEYVPCGSMEPCPFTHNAWVRAAAVALLVVGTVGFAMASRRGKPSRA